MAASGEGEDGFVACLFAAATRGVLFEVVGEHVEGGRDEPDRAVGEVARAAAFYLVRSNARSVPVSNRTFLPTAIESSESAIAASP